MKLTKKTEDRLHNSIAKFQKVLAIAKDRDLNESDTVAIITDMLAEIFGYDKYLEVTSELAIRGTYCDLAIKMNDKFEYIIECKAIGTELKDIHLRQAIGYGANKGIQWIILTNGMDWNVYRLRFEQPIQWDLVAHFNFSTFSMKNERDIEKLMIVTKEGVEKNARNELYEKIQCVNRYVVGQLILAEPCVTLIRRELKKLSEGINIEDAEIIAMLKDNVLRRELLDAESEEVASAVSKVAKFYRHSAVKKPAPKKEVESETAPAAQPVEQKSVTELLLAEAESKESQPEPSADTSTMA